MLSPNDADQRIRRSRARATDSDDILAPHNMAVTWLKEDGAPLGELASRLGYQSEAAFSRAFKRFIGTSPSVARRASQAGS